MKKRLLLVALLALTFSAPAFAVNGNGEPTLTNYTIKKATGGVLADANREVRLVRFGDNDQDDASLVSGDLVVWDTLSDDGVTVTTTTTSGDARIAGVVATTIPTGDGKGPTAYDDVAHRNWGYIIVSGPANVNVTAAGTNGNSAGDPFITSTDAKAATSFEAAGAVYGRSSADKNNKTVKGGFFLDASDATSTSYEVYVQLN